MRIELLYFAAARDVVGKARESVELPNQVTSVGSFLEWLVRRYPDLDPHQASLRVARNEAFADLHERITENDVLAIIPPVAGG
jgi:molybdopterin converting factor subunit 1